MLTKLLKQLIRAGTKGTGIKARQVKRIFGRMMKPVSISKSLLNSMSDPFSLEFEKTKTTK